MSRQPAAGGASRFLHFIAGLSAASLLWGQSRPHDPAKEFTESIRPVLATHCGTCHNPVTGRNPANFLKAQSVDDIESQRGLWRNVASQIRNRSMPPVASKITEEERLQVASWVENRLKETACRIGEFAGAAAIRRLNRREYRNTIRDLLGVDLDLTDVFPADGSGGSGFDTNGETLYVGPLLSERYLEAAQQALDRVIITPPVYRSFAPAAMSPAVAVTSGKRNVAAGEEISAVFPAYASGKYQFAITIERIDPLPKVSLKTDGANAGVLTVPAVRGFGGLRGGRGTTAPITLSV